MPNDPQMQGKAIDAVVRAPRSPNAKSFGEHARIAAQKAAVSSAAPAQAAPMQQPADRMVASKALPMPVIDAFRQASGANQIPAYIRYSDLARLAQERPELGELIGSV